MPLTVSAASAGASSGRLEVAIIKNPKAYEKGLAELPDWRIGCIFTNAKDRGRGVTATAVAAALGEIRRDGGC